MIEVKDIYKSFAGKEVLKNVSAVFEQGKTNLIIGQSGSGKTVLLKCIVGLHEVDSGEIWFNNNILFNKLSFKEKKEMRKQIGMLFQGSALFDFANVEDNVRFPLEMFSDMSREEQDERINFCLKRVNIINANKLFPSELSGGMQKRVAIARAIAFSPKYLFCDEPNSGLDPRTSILIDNLIKEITEEYKITTIINTHDMNSVMEIGDKVVFIHEGEKWWEGSKDNILHADNKELNDFVFASKMAKTLKGYVEKSS
ncbi:MAG: ATP-binding cassette domain-containing protein [Prevotellaceae bacterium]|jgi:phospholipid/cholesterol/gamma-HCH transport system ATP-binding protein|nr:ATP-binding cassette domain-containing protein [Prevotellaceae bacterium]